MTHPSDPTDTAPGTQAAVHERHAPSDYSRWRGLAGRWNSTDDFLSTPSHQTGVHLIEDDEGPLDVYVIGDPLHNPDQPGLPVFFSGAITKRDGSPGPFFSGLTIARAVGVSALAVSDRTITRHRELPLAWYEGCADDRLGPQLARFLGAVHRRCGKRLILTGGSGGGFAALQMERRLSGMATAFCWNPQTDLLRYSERTTRQYLASCFPEIQLPGGTISNHREELRPALESLGLATTCWTSDLPMAQSVLYLQNGQDWHVDAHAMPFASAAGLSLTTPAVYQRDGVAMLLGSWGEGHSVPPREVLEEAIRVLASRPDPQLAADHLSSTFPEVFTVREQSGGDSPGTSAPPAGPKKIFVYGSCVSRDAVTHMMSEHEVSVAAYVARQSLISAAHPADSALVEGARLESRFQRRMLEGDATSRLWAQLSAHAPYVDTVLCDFTDERLGVYLFPDGSVLTRSLELINSGLEPQVADAARLLPFGSDEHFALWLSALELFADRLTALGLKDRTVLLLLPWAHFDTAGQPVPPSFGLAPEQADAIYQRYNDAVVTHFPSQAVLRDIPVRADASHRWGLAPFHYDEATYDLIVEEINHRVAVQAVSPLGPGETRVFVPTLRREGAEILVVESGADAGTRTSYHLYRGRSKVDEIAYGTDSTATFRASLPGSYFCRVYYLDDRVGLRTAASTGRCTVPEPPTGPTSA